MSDEPTTEPVDPQAEPVEPQPDTADDAEVPETLEQARKLRSKNRALRQRLHTAETDNERLLTQTAAWQRREVERAAAEVLIDAGDVWRVDPNSNRVSTINSSVRYEPTVWSRRPRSSPARSHTWLAPRRHRLNSRLKDCVPVQVPNSRGPSRLGARHCAVPASRMALLPLVRA